MHQVVDCLDQLSSASMRQAMSPQCGKATAQPSKSALVQPQQQTPCQPHLILMQCHWCCGASRPVSRCWCGHHADYHLPHPSDHQSNGLPSLKKPPWMLGPACSTAHTTDAAPCSGERSAVEPPMSVLQQWDMQHHRQQRCLLPHQVACEQGPAFLGQAGCTSSTAQRSMAPTRGLLPCPTCCQEHRIQLGRSHSQAAVQQSSAPAQLPSPAPAGAHRHHAHLLAMHAGASRQQLRRLVQDRLHDSASGSAPVMCLAWWCHTARVADQGAAGLMCSDKAINCCMPVLHTAQCRLVLLIARRPRTVPPAVQLQCSLTCMCYTQQHAPHHAMASRQQHCEDTLLMQ